ncbi:MAG TPA: hypothetical protein VL737_04840 [Candidatus Pristimantibacillus sp.]|nr:hypothetical protein [Candidatus Pristimantibacillus sp.]
MDILGPDQLVEAGEDRTGIGADELAYLARLGVHVAVMGPGDTMEDLAQAVAPQIIEHLGSQAGGQ